VLCAFVVIAKNPKNFFAGFAVNIQFSLNQKILLIFLLDEDG
jgi:hypothetical protein